MTLWTAPPEALVEAMHAHDLRRGYLVTPPGTDHVVPSHPLFEPLAAAVSADRRDYRRHQGCFFEIGRESGHLLTAFLHWTHRGQGAGGVRFWRYPTLESMVRDGLRLSRGMGHKCALAGLWWGGGKGVIARQRSGYSRSERDAIYRDYGRFVSSLQGVYVTAEDAGTLPQDMARVFETTRHTTCIPVELGGSGNPSVLTASGVVVAAEAALAYTGGGSLEGKTIAMQGLGNVSTYMVGDLLERGVSRIVANDIVPQHVDGVRARYPDGPITLSVCQPHDVSIFETECDVFVPNAVGAILNDETIPRIRAPIVCGGANNQLEDPDRHGPALEARGILYVPDFLANRMGIVNCANEQYGRLSRDPDILRHLDREAPAGIYQRSLEVFRRARASGRCTAEEAVRLADELSLEPHPIWGNRGQQIIDDLVATNWSHPT